MSEINKVTYKIKNLSDAPISFVGLHSLSIPGTSEAEYSMSESGWKRLLPRIRAKKTLIVKSMDEASAEATAKAATAATTTTTKTSTKSTKSSSTDSTTSSKGATTSTKEG